MESKQNTKTVRNNQSALVVESLRSDEIDIIRKYQKHLWEVSSIALTHREILTRIISECGTELEMVGNDLKASR